MDILSHYITAAHKAVHAASNGCDAVNEIADLAPLEAELRTAFDYLTLRPDPIAMAAERSRKAAIGRENERFMLSWRGHGGNEIVTGWTALANRLGLRPNTLQVYLSKGKGAFKLLRYHPETRERDQLIIIRESKEESVKRPVGRPPKQQDWERLGTNAPNSPDAA